MTERLIEVNFPFRVMGDDALAEALLQGDPRVTSAILYNAADQCATSGPAATGEVICGTTVMRNVQGRRTDWLLIWIALVGGVVLGTALTTAVFLA